MMKIDCLPLNWDGFAYLNEPKNYEKTIDRTAETSADDQIPF
jgi:hypothetical protein